MAIHESLSDRRGCRGILTIVLLFVLCGRAATASQDAVTGWTIRTEPGHAMVPLRGAVEFKITLLDAKNQPVPADLAARVDVKTAARTPITVGVGPSGGTYRFRALPDMAAGIHTVDFRDAASRAAHTLYVDVVDPETYRAFAEAAAKVRFGALPVHLLFIGDSLTDFQRGQNYVDKVEFWLAKRFGPQVTVRNAGVGGDTITRVWQRLSGEPKTYRLSMYDDLFVPRPTHVLFFLGHNDSKLTSASRYTQPVVDPKEFEADYRQAIEKVQRQTGAKVVVLSATSSVYEITQTTAAKARAKGKAHNLFGKPEALEQFNAIARRVAKDCGADYLDVYEPTRLSRDKPSLFMPDGVHVNNEGNRLLALKVLGYLAGEK